MHFFSPPSATVLQRGFILKLLLIVFLGIFLCAWGVRAFILPPVDFPAKTAFEIKDGDSLGAVAYRLQQVRMIKSPEAFKLLMLAFGSEKDLSVGEYYFEAPVTAVEVALKLSGNEFGVMQNRITFPEGFTNKDMAARLEARIEGFDGAAFLALAKDDQGYLFPDTYGFAPKSTPETIVAALKKNFIEKTSALEADFAASKRKKSDIIIMASLIEKEANDGEEAQVIAGILWKRIDLGIALQVDAPFLYILGKTSAELTVKDLAMDSPYNTYRNRGLVPAPINNPGLAAISAALRPIESPYLYYLHGSDGAVHYARTHDEHLANKKKYLQ